MGGEGDFGASVTAFEMLGHADLSLLVKAGVHWGLFGGAVANLGTQRHHTAPAPHHQRRAARLLRDDRDRARLRRPVPADDGDLRPRDRRDRRPHAQTCAARKDYIGGAARDGRLAAVFAQLVTDGESTACTACSSRSATRTASRCPGSPSATAAPRPAFAGSTTGGCPSTTCGCPAPTCSTGTATSTSTAPTPPPSRTPRGGSSRCSARWSGAGSAWPAGPARPPGPR